MNIFKEIKLIFNVDFLINLINIYLVNSYLLLFFPGNNFVSLLLEIHTRKHDKNIAEERSDEDNDDDADAEQTTSMRVTHIEITTEGRSLHEIKPKCQHVDDGSKIVDLS